MLGRAATVFCREGSGDTVCRNSDVATTFKLGALRKLAKSATCGLQFTEGHHYQVLWPTRTFLGHAAHASFALAPDAAPPHMLAMPAHFHLRFCFFSLAHVVLFDFV